ncbi:hypothetical protein ASZ90_009749 [hydrocarbon metagenome]|uniref:HEAT repeat domain-containing protein n=1 Tax=hydrocarbon metagenome TaxID=938273 RepID=A0A0W8FII0_9ZZZZ|nr:HEAT repeat domain-containing protein [Methanomicrobiaceae archaeon]
MMEEGYQKPRSIKDYTIDCEGMQALREALIIDDDPRVRQMASLLLGQTGDSRAIEPLIEALRDPEKEVRGRAAIALAAIGSPAIPPLIAALKDSDWRVRYRAAEALGSIGDRAAFEPLMAALSDEKDHVRYMAAKGLGSLREERAMDALIAAQNDCNEFVRRSAAAALGSIGGDDARRALEAALQREVDGSARAAILQALEETERESV